MAVEKSVIRSVRLSLNIDKMITTIAKYEDRTVSKTLSRLIFRGLANYIVSHESDEDNKFFDFLRRNFDANSGFKDFLDTKGIEGGEYPSYP